MVSELPIITEAQKDGKLSAPSSSIRDEYAAIDALPEKGRVMRRVISSDGIFKKDVTGVISSAKKSAAPDAISIFVPTITTQRVGISLKAQAIPSSAPLPKASKLTFFEKSNMRAASVTTIGTEKAAIFSMRYIFSSLYVIICIRVL